ncbi:hypothetical protein B0H19DRAFT_1272800 [Mycena capillaripes]|nr:hypothetical protein B0H19DRAFT_1272800 [Mycena capillaripes]
MSSLATFCDVPVSAVFDDNAANSSVSLDWVVHSGLRTRNSQASGHLCLPSDISVISLDINVTIAASLASDLVLGLDWFQFVQHTGLEGIVHLSSGPLDIRHRPLPPFATPGSPETSSYIHPLSAAPMLREALVGTLLPPHQCPGPGLMYGPQDVSYAGCPTTSYAGWNTTYAWCCL